MKPRLNLTFENLDEHAGYRFIRFIGYLILGLDASGEPKKA